MGEASDAQGLQEVEVLRQAHHGEVQEAFRVVLQEPLVRGAFRVRRAAPQVWVLHVREPLVQRGLHVREPLAQRGLHVLQVLDNARQVQRVALAQAQGALRAWVPFGGPFPEQLLREPLVRLDHELAPEEHIDFHAKVADHQTRIQIPSGPSGSRVVACKQLHRLKAFCTDPLDYLG